MVYSGNNSGVIYEAESEAAGSGIGHGQAAGVPVSMWPRMATPPNRREAAVLPEM